MHVSTKTCFDKLCSIFHMHLVKDVQCFYKRDVLWQLEALFKYLPLNKISRPAAGEAVVWVSLKLGPHIIWQDWAISTLIKTLHWTPVSVCIVVTWVQNAPFIHSFVLWRHIPWTFLCGFRVCVVLTFNASSCLSPTVPKKNPWFNEWIYELQRLKT